MIRFKVERRTFVFCFLLCAVPVRAVTTQQPCASCALFLNFDPQFKSAKDYDTMECDGPFVSAHEVKAFITEKANLGKVDYAKGDCHTARLVFANLFAPPGPQLRFAALQRAKQRGVSKRGCHDPRKHLPHCASCACQVARWGQEI